MVEDAMTEDGIKIHFFESAKVLDGTNPDELFIFQIEAAISKKFIADLRAKVRLGLEQKKLAGEYVGQAPLGYKSQNGKLLTPV